MKVKVYAKINLSLNCCGVENGFHRLDTVMASVDIADVISVLPRTDKTVTVTFSSGLMGEKTNAYKAATLMVEKANCLGADIFIEQNIPSGAGLGGSSADAAGVIRAMAKLYEIDEITQVEIAKSIGSDVPYMLKGGFARLKGTHTGIDYFDAIGGEILLYGSGSVSTGECFALFDASGNSGVESDNEALITALKCGGVICARKHFSNALYPAASTLNPEIARVKSAMERANLSACMTGSGSFVFGVGTDEELTKAQELCLNAKRVKIVNSGIEFI
jgi:4-diphosphocytidyl-2C-methyl-D-erythritol kinase